MKKRTLCISLIMAIVCIFTLTACGIFSSGSESATDSNDKIGEGTIAEQLYAEAVSYGYTGTLEEFIASLQGASAYDIAVKNGFSGTEEEWLASLKGADGKDGQNGKDGEQIVAEAIQGESAYEIAVRNGFSGTETEWLASLKGEDGEDGRDGQDAALTVYDIYQEGVENGFSGSFSDFLTTYLTLTADEGINADNLLSSVSIICSFPVQQTVGSPWTGYQTRTVVSTSAGSGVLYSLNRETGEAYVITNYHVVYYSGSTVGISNNICVCLYGSEIIGSEFYSEEHYGSSAVSERGMAINATYVGGSMYYDLAVLKITDERLKTADLATVNFADSNEIRVGQTAYAVGNAEGEGIAVTKGVVSVDSENITMTASDGRSYTTFRVMRIDTPVNSGNSGGGLFDSEGNLIGIVNAKTNADGVENISYALPSNVVKYIVENILYYKDSADKTSDVRKCLLGVSVMTVQSSAVLGEDGIVRIKETIAVADVTEGSLADGYLTEGDVLVSVVIERGGEEETYIIDRSFILVDLMLTMRVGDSLTLNYQRAGESGQVSFVMTEECISEIG